MVDGWILCDNTQIGGDPAPGHDKQCFCTGVAFEAELFNSFPRFGNSTLGISYSGETLQRTDLLNAAKFRSDANLKALGRNVVPAVFWLHEQSGGSESSDSDNTAISGGFTDSDISDSSQYRGPAGSGSASYTRWYGNGLARPMYYQQGALSDSLRDLDDLGQQPDNRGGNQRCVRMFVTGSWDDYDCATARPFVCARPTLKVCPRIEAI
jgi:hypothetical protein